MRMAQDVATCMYCTGIKPFGKKTEFNAGNAVDLALHAYENADIHRSR
jgi:hypothetical protein